MFATLRQPWPQDLESDLQPHALARDVMIASDQAMGLQLGIADVQGSRGMDSRLSIGKPGVHKWYPLASCIVLRVPCTHRVLLLVCLNRLPVSANLFSGI